MIGHGAASFGLGDGFRSYRESYSNKQFQVTTGICIVETWAELNSRPKQLSCLTSTAIGTATLWTTQHAA